MDETKELTTLSKVERYLIANQLRLLEKLDPQNAQEYQKDRDIIVHGYAIEYEDVFAEIYDEMTVDEGRYVYDVLDLYRVLIRSYEELKDKEGLTLDDVKFQGFDGNNESKRWAFTKHLKEEGRWTETLTGVPLNSHSMSTMSLYPKMLERFEPIQRAILDSHSGNWILTADQIKKVINWKAPESQTKTERGQNAG
jgi:uncharacterized protein YfbU (UPF0304 family)